MSTIAEHVTEDDLAVEALDEGDGVEDGLEVHRDLPLSLGIGATSGALALAFLLRGVGTGGLLTWALCLVTTAIAIMHLAAVIDGRAPLLVVDKLGVRVRRGALWQGVAWSEIAEVEHRARVSTLRDGALTFVTSEGRRLGVRLSLSTRLVGADWHEVEEALTELSDGSVAIVDGAAAPDPDLGEPASVPEAEEDPETTVEAEQTSVVAAPVEAQREARAVGRADVVFARPTVTMSDPDGEESEVPIAAETETIVIAAVTEDRTGSEIDAPSAHIDPIVGPQLSAARARIGISVEALAERTRIRPHVIEAIEVDDFEPCGGDFYARGHLRTLGRVLGVDAAPLLSLYDEHYAHAPIDARRVFEAELASGPSRTRGVGGGLNWSVLVAAVMAVVLVWSVARLVMDGPVPMSDQPVLNGSPGGKATLSGATTKVSVSLTAATGGSRVIVRDAKQQVVFDSQLAFMQTAELDVAPPVRISTTDGGLLVSVDGVDEGAIGATGQDAQRTYVP